MSPTYERNTVGSLRHLLGDGQHEDAEGEQHRDAEGDLLAALGRHAEHQQRQHRHHHAGQHDVVHVEQRLPADDERDGDVRKRLRTAAVTSAG